MASSNICLALRAVVRIDGAFTNEIIAVCDAVCTLISWLGGSINIRVMVISCGWKSSVPVCNGMFIIYSN